MDRGRGDGPRFDDPRTSDFTVACEGREIAVHKSVLVQRSPFLRRFLEADPACTRINASNARYAAMVVVLRSLYSAAADEFGAHRFDPAVVTSTWEIAMHFQLADFAAVATTRLLELVDRECAFRVLKATLKHKASAHAKTLQQHLVAARLLPPVLHGAAEQAEWERAVTEHPWLQDALSSSQADQQRREAEVNASTPKAPVAAATKTSPAQRHDAAHTPVTAAGREERLEELRHSYTRYFANRQQQQHSNTPSGAGSVLGRLGLGTPGKGVEYDAVDIDDDDDDANAGDRAHATAELSASATKLRDGVNQAADDLAGITAALNTMRFGGAAGYPADDDGRGTRSASSQAAPAASRRQPPPPPSAGLAPPPAESRSSSIGRRSNRSHRRYADSDDDGDARSGRATPQHHHHRQRHANRDASREDAGRAEERAREAELLEGEIARLKAAYAAELAAFHQRCDDLRGDMDAAIADDVGAVEARCDELQELKRALAAEEQAEAAEADQLRQEAATADAFVRDGALYIRAVDAAVEELIGGIGGLRANDGRSATRREVGAVALEAKRGRDEQRAALDAAKDKEQALQGMLDAEHDTVRRLQRTLRRHDDFEIDAADAVVGAAF